MIAGLSFPFFNRIFRKRANIPSSDKSTRRSSIIFLARRKTGSSMIGSIQSSLLIQTSGWLYMFFPFSLRDRRLKSEVTYVVLVSKEPGYQPSVPWLSSAGGYGFSIELAGNISLGVPLQKFLENPPYDRHFVCCTRAELDVISEQVLPIAVVQQTFRLQFLIH